MIFSIRNRIFPKWPFEISTENLIVSIAYFIQSVYNYNIILLNLQSTISKINLSEDEAQFALFVAHHAELWKLFAQNASIAVLNPR
jgi:hypothetical protein